MRIIPVSDVPRGKLLGHQSVDRRVREVLNQPVEAYELPARHLVSCNDRNALVNAATLAFYEHLPLVLRPDDVWLCVAQGLASHVNRNAEELRSRFVRHEGRKQLSVFRPDFELGRENPWPEVFAEFSEQVGGHVGRLHGLVSASFSTTTPMEAAAFDVAVMDTFQAYFEYVVFAGCGIPEVRLLGTPEDWESMVPRVRYLSELGLETWSATLVPVLEKIAAAAAGEIDESFWRSFFHYEDMSGRATVSGWLLTLFPYVRIRSDSEELRDNPFLGAWRAHFEGAASGGGPKLDQGPDISVIPPGLVSAPVTFHYIPDDTITPLRFVAGHFGVNQDEETHAVAPVFGWAVVREGETRAASSEAEPAD
ncbi:MAG: DUF4419 domain-containing protein [Acidobacteriota bacterium]